jgi:quinol monooxygenase YgiN
VPLLDGSILPPGRLTGNRNDTDHPLWRTTDFRGGPLGDSSKAMTRSQLHLRARPGERDELLRELDRLEVFVAVGDQPGFLGAEVLVPDDDDDAVLVAGSWSSPEHYERWRASTVRADLLRELQPLLDGEPQLVVYQVVDAIS